MIVIKKRTFFVIRVHSSGMVRRHTHTDRERETEMAFYSRWNKEENKKKQTTDEKGEKTMEDSSRNLFHSLQWEWKAFARDSIPFVQNVRGNGGGSGGSGGSSGTKMLDVRDEKCLEFNSIPFQHVAATASMQYFNLVWV